MLLKQEDLGCQFIYRMMLCMVVGPITGANQAAQSWLQIHSNILMQQVSWDHLEKTEADHAVRQGPEIKPYAHLFPEE